jgi:hypothetical protein
MRNPVLITVRVNTKAISCVRSRGPGREAITGLKLSYQAIERADSLQEDNKKAE